MAKKAKAISFKNARIDLDDMTITEIYKDGSQEFNIREVLKDWDGVEGISLVLRKDKDILPQ